MAFQSCLDFRSCPEDVLGKYSCQNDPEAINYLQLNADSTFLHYFGKEELKLSHFGTWKRSSKSSCTIEFSEWKSYNESGESYETFGSGILWISGEYLDITPDGYSDTSFIKEEY